MCAIEEDIQGKARQDRGEKKEPRKRAPEFLWRYLSLYFNPQNLYEIEVIKSWAHTQKQPCSSHANILRKPRNVTGGGVTL